MEIHTEHIIAFLEGKLSTEKQAGLKKALEKSPELQKEFNDIRFIHKMSSELNLHRKADTTRNWNELSRRIKAHTFRIRLGHFIRNTAAILLIPALITTYILLEKAEKPDYQPIEMTEIASAPGIISKVTLPDGSEVWLNSGSTLTYPTRFTGKREVSLTGEAYFKVISDKTNRFDVTIENDLTVSAYGTEFNINAYTGDNKIRATLVNGNIEVSHADAPESYIVHPGEQLTYDKESEEIQTSGTNLAVVTGWKEGKMIFRRAGMTEINQRLSRRFNVNVRLEGEELYGYEYSATFTHETLDEILRLLEESAPIRCRIIEPKQTDDLSYTKRTVVISTLTKK